jgi:hypothetical protein
MIKGGERTILAQLKGSEGQFQQNKKKGKKRLDKNSPLPYKFFIVYTIFSVNS